ncbi:hypothetical protein [Serratia sp. JSRIV004]|uniref:hypothetical protein n=1 Tax=Serratia sp. JSRIV004 TaxID=2831895 RepID=UPI00353026A0|nr:hypothetical protein KGP21_11620 [Serratia sp. JSRIV004]
MMAKAWKDVIASPQFQQLPPDQQAAAQDQYFNEVVAPQAGDQAEAARQQFFAAYPPAAAAQSPQEQTQAQKIGAGFAETGKALLQAGVNVANIPAEIADAFTSAGSWAANQLGIGDGTYSPSPRLTTQGIASGVGLPQDALTPQSTEGKIFAEALPYLTPVSASRFGAAAPTLAGRVTQGASRLLAENATGALAANSGENGSMGGVLQDLGIGVAAGGAVNLAAKGIGAAAKAFGNRGVEAAGENLRNVVTQGAQSSDLGATARTIAESPESSLLSRNVSVQGAGGESASVTPQAFRAAEEVRPNQSTIDAAKRLGLEEQLLPSHFSKNPTYRAIEQGLKSVPASQLAAQEHVAINALAQKADDLIEVAGGTSNKVGLSDKFKTESIKAIDDLTKKSDAIYGEISSKIPARAPSVATNTISMLKSKAKDLGGIENLSPAEKMIFSKLGKKGSTPTYALLDNTRKQIGAAISKNEGPFKDQTSAELKQLYGAITDDQKVVAAAHGMGDKWDVAKGLVSQRKQLEDHMVTALGKDLGGTFTSRLSPAIQGLRKGNVQQFNTLIAATPPHMRQEVVASALNDAFTLGSRKEQQLNIPGFVDWYSGAKRSGALPAVTKHLPADAAKRLDDIYAVANGIRVAKSSEISTGRIQSLLDQFDKDGGMISKVYNIGKKAAAAEGVTSSLGAPGIGTASVIASTLAGKKTARTVAADQLIASSKFRNAARLMASGDSIRLASAREGVQKALTRSREYQRWAATLDNPTRQAIAKVGLLNWLGGTAEEK